MKRRFRCPTCGEVHDRLVCNCWKCPSIDALCPNCGASCGKLKDGEPAPPPKPVAKVIDMAEFKQRRDAAEANEIERILFGED